jgi:predicted nucleic acid-binding protein
MTLIFNASPLIVLAKSELLDCFLQLGESVLIPCAVAEEISHAIDPGDPARKWIARNSALIQPVSPVSPFVMAWDLGAGESAVITLAATTSGAVAILDDLAARRCAQAIGLNIVGSLGLVLMAKRAGLIPSATQALDAIVAAGLFISPNHLKTIRIQAGELLE